MQTNTEIRASKPQLPDASAGHRRMRMFVGAWRSVPHDSYVGEWLPGELSVILRWDHVLWVMSYDRKSDDYPMHRFDDAGNAVEYRATVIGDVWTITGEHQRATITFSDDGATMTLQWSRRDGAAWIPLRDVGAIRAAR